MSSRSITLGGGITQREALISLKCLHTTVKEDELAELLSITTLAMELFL